MEDLTLYHGSSAAVTLPRLELCRPNNDYGQGFYCTRSVELAKEWACQKGRDGFANAYELDMRGLALVDLNAESYCILHWLAILLENRLCRLSTPTMQRGATWIAKRFPVDLSDADVVKGYRADDSYFSFARAFLRNEITLEHLSRAMRLGELGEQYMIKSPAGFAALRYVGGEVADSSMYWPLRQRRDAEARAAFQDIVAEKSPPESALPPLYISSLMAMSEEELYACLR